MLGKDQILNIVRSVDTPIEVKYTGFGDYVHRTADSVLATRVIDSMESSYPFHFHSFDEARNGRRWIHAWTTEYSFNPKNRVEVCDLRWKRS